MRNQAFYSCKNKDAEQLYSNCTAISTFFATETVQFLFFLNPKLLIFKGLAFFCDCTDLFVLDLVGNPKDRFSCIAAQM